MEAYMSAKTHMLLQKLEELKYAIELRVMKGEDPTDLQESLSQLQSDLLTASQAIQNANVNDLLKG